MGGYLAEQGYCERLYGPWLDEIMQGGAAPALEDKIREDASFVTDLLEKDRMMILIAMMIMAVTRRMRRMRSAV